MKCYNCQRLPNNHSFNRCLTSDCACPCVEQIRSSCNIKEYEVSENAPRYLKISSFETKQLPNADGKIRKFNKLRKDEWLYPKRKLKRHRLD